ncbi:MAG: hypothetical protein Q8P18_05725 [Pseudomonadota bacterium]|nr:hypothetical protein [Pseudomonadota bacterium]
MPINVHFRQLGESPSDPDSCSYNWSGTKPNPLAKLHRIRGVHAHPAVLVSVERMTEAEAEGWYRLIQNMEEDARSAGAREGARQPWKWGGF